MTTEEVHVALQDCFYGKVGYLGQTTDYWFFVTEHVQMKVSKENYATYYRVYTTDEWKYDFNLYN